MSGHKTAILMRLVLIALLILHCCLRTEYVTVCLCLCLCRLMLQFDIPDVTREGVGVCCQLMVGQSSVPHYQQLEEFTARLAPGEVSLLVCIMYM